jgi:hypothetical protein
LIIGQNWSEGKARDSYRICKPCANRATAEWRSEKNYALHAKLNNRQCLIDTLGNYCACCKNDQWQFLTLDHIYNDGCDERRNNSNPFNLSSFARKKNSVDISRYQILCMNCNFCKGHNGFCPHKFQITGDSCAMCNHTLDDSNWSNPIRLYNNKICNDCLVFLSVRRKDKPQPIFGSKLKKKLEVLRLKHYIVEGYDGKCECCNENEMMFLTIDHINGGGREENRKLSKAGVEFYRHLKKLGYPRDNYRLLCYNCNCSREIWGQCYHELCRQQNLSHIGIDMYRDMVLSGKIVA